MERVESSPILCPLVIILKTPLHHLHVVLYNFLSFNRIISLELSFIIYPDDIFIALILGCVNHVSFELESLFDTFFVDHPVLIGKFVNFSRPIFPEYASLIVTQETEKNLCSSPVHDTPVCYIAIQFIS